jgi:hypothetical protein
MSRFIAITEKPGLTEAQFRDALDRTRKWRFARRGWVLKAYCSTGSGKLVIECEASEQKDFEEWLTTNGWPTDEIFSVDMIHEAGHFWPIRP